jgi:hypothetical protein
VSITLTANRSLLLDGKTNVFCYFGYQPCVGALRDLCVQTEGLTSAPPGPVRAQVINTHLLQCRASRCVEGFLRGTRVSCQSAPDYTLDLVVVVAGQVSISNQAWRYIPEPAVYSILPTTGAIHVPNSITIAGKHFVDATKVTLILIRWC